MRKMLTIFVRTPDYKATPEITPGCEWVFAGEGWASRKWDGTACRLRDGKWYVRYDAKHGKTPPADFEPCEPERNLETGHWPGWIPLSATAPEHRWIREAIANSIPYAEDGTFEAIGPKIASNHDGHGFHAILRHGMDSGGADKIERTFEGIRAFLERTPIKGIVFHHPDGRMAKIKRRDFGFPWPVK